MKLYFLRMSACEWIKSCADGHEDIEFYPRIERLSTDQNPETVADVCEVLVRDRRMT